MSTAPPAGTVDGPTWASRTGFVLATIGSAIGIGSIWKFPYEVGANGGGAFVIFYVLGLALVVVPLMLAEMALGRSGRADAATSIAAVAARAGISTRWRAVGLLGALTAFLVLSYYAVIAGWTIRYAIDTARNGLPGTTAGVAAEFDDLLASPGRMMLFQAVFLALVVAVVVRGVQRGIEAAMKVLMPLLGVMLVVLAVYSMRTGDAGATVRFLFVPDFDHFDARRALEALGLGFFSIGVGLGLMITYAAYSPATADLKVVALASVVADTLISVVAGLAVFPVVFAHGLDPAGGPGLVFSTLPRAFADMPGGRAAGVLFFALLTIAALGSAVSLLEAFVAVLGHRFGLDRGVAATAGTIACFAVGIATVLSFNDWAGVRPLGGIDRFETHTIFDLLDDATSNVMLPLGGLALSVLCGWRLSDRLLVDELALGGRALRGLQLMLRIVAPFVIVASVVVWFTAE